MTNITAGMPDNRKSEALAAIMPPGDTYKLALIKVGATVGKIDTYSALGANEVAAGNGYTAGGIALSGYTAASTDGVASVDFADAVWPTSNISADGAVLYDSTTGKVLEVIDFGATITSNGGDFTVNIPSSGVGLVRLG
jgi:hypothetical protein